MRFSLIPREMRFFDLFDEVAVLLTKAAQQFVDMVTQFDNLPARSLQLKELEDSCDRTIERIIKALDRTFITPFDREDIHSLATSLDDIMDNLEETAHRFQVFRIDRPTPESIELARLHLHCCEHLEQALKALRNMKKPEEIQARILDISKLENEADRIYRKADADLFANAVAAGNGGGDHSTRIDLLSLIKWRELYYWLETTIDSNKEVANIISEIVIKGS